MLAKCACIAACFCFITATYLLMNSLCQQKCVVIEAEKQDNLV